jgi:protein O-mannosyl-transferase
MSQKKLKRLRKLKKNADEIFNDVKIEHIGIKEILRKNWKFLMILCLGVVALYFNSLWGDFVSDDYATIPQNPEIMNIKATLNLGFFVSFIKTLIALIFGIISPIPYHVVNLVLYLLVCIVTFVFLKLIFNDLVSKIALVIFAVLPIHVETVSWISGVPYLVSSLLIISELICLIYFFRSKNKKYLVWLFLFTILSIFSDWVRYLGFILLAILTLVSFKNELNVKTNLKKIFLILGFLFLALFLLSLPMIMKRIDSVNSGINASESIFYNPFFQYPTAITKYLQLILIPTDLTLYHTMYVVPAWLNWTILLLYLIAVGWYFVKDKKIFFALSFIFLATASSMAPVKVSWLVAERYMFLGSLGMALLLGILAEKFWNKKVMVVIILSVLTVVYSVRVFMRNIDWQTNHNLWVNTCQMSPNSHNAWNNIGDDYDRLAQKEIDPKKQYKQYLYAIRSFQESFTIKPNYADAFHNQANIFYKIGRLDLARNGYETAIHLNPNMPQTLKTLVQLDLMEKNITELDKHLFKLQQLNPNDLEVAYITALSYIQTERGNQVRELVNGMYKQFPSVAEIKGLYDSLNLIKESSSSGVRQ